MSASWKELLAAAQAQVADTLAALPGDLREAAKAVPVLYQRRPSDALVADGLDADLLGLFVGEPHGQEAGGSPLPAQILLFLENIWELADDDPEFYADEVRTTFLHELGHYLGLDELDLEDRGLE